MNERYVTPHTLPTPHERELLVILMEECAEIQYHVAKALRFGMSDAEPGQPETNRERISDEIGDLRAVAEKAHEAGLIDWERMREAQIRKHAKLARFMQTTPA